MSQELRWYGAVLPKHLTDVKVIVLADLHYGNPYCSLKHFLEVIRFVKEKENCYCYLNGDLLEAVTRQSKGDVYKQEDTPQDQRNDVIGMLMPIKDKILGMTTGNHEQRIYNETGVDLSADIAKALGVPYRPEGMFHKIRVGSGNSGHQEKPYVFTGYFSHGYGGARTKSAKAVKAERLAYMLHADWYAMSHDHVVNAAPNIFLEDDIRWTKGKDGFWSGKVTAHRSMLIKTNAFLKWGGYAEAGGFPPSDLSTPVIHLLTPQSKQWDDFPEKPRQAVKVSV